MTVIQMSDRELSRLRVMVGLVDGRLTVDAAEAPLAIGYVTKSATNQGWLLINTGAAAAQAEWVAGQIGGTDEIILVDGSLAQSTGRDRRQGFLDRLMGLPRNGGHR